MGKCSICDDFSRGNLEGGLQTENGNACFRCVKEYGEDKCKKILKEGEK